MKRFAVFLSVWATALACILGGSVPAPASAARPATAVAPAASLTGTPVALGAADPLSVVINLTTTADPTYPVTRQLALDSANATMTLQSLRDNHIALAAFTGLAYTGFTFELDPPAGQRLHVGTYTGVNRGQPDNPAKATLAVNPSGNRRGEGGDVEIRDIAIDASGTVSRLDLVFRINSGGPANTVFGSVRFGQAETPGRTLSAHAISWPNSPIGAPLVLATESIHNTGSAPLSLGAASVTGVNRADFTIQSDGCRGQTLQPGQACPVVVGFTPTAAGRRSATLNLPIDGGTDTVELKGEAPPGFSRLLTSGNDYISNGAVHDYVDGPYQLEASGTRFPAGYQRLYFAPTKVYDYDFDGLAIRLRSPVGQPMTIGNHPADDYYFGSTAAYGIDVSGIGRGCRTQGSVNIKQLTYSPDGTPLTADIAFTQVCIPDLTGAVMKGEITWRLPVAATPAPPSRLDFNGDGRADVMAVRSDGAMYLYRGNGFGSFSGSGVRIGSGWGIFTKVLSAGDFTGDGHGDLLGVRADGALYLYRGNGVGSFSGSGVRIGSGWGIFTKVLSPGDFTGDGHGDLLAVRGDGVLFLYRGNGLGGFTGAGVRVGSGWAAFTKVLSPGDFTGDGNADLLAVRADGTLSLYRGNGLGGFTGAGIKVGSGWAAFTTVLSVGDFTGDGHADLLAVRADGTLNLYRGNGLGSFSGSGTRIGSGWSIFTTVF